MRDFIESASITTFIGFLIVVVLVLTGSVRDSAPHADPCEICPIGTCGDSSLPHAPNPGDE